MFVTVSIQKELRRSKALFYMKQSEGGVYALVTLHRLATLSPKKIIYATLLNKPREEIMDYILAIIAILVFGGGCVAVCFYLRQVKFQLASVGEKMASQSNDDGKAGIVLIPVTKLDPKAEISTVLPLPMGAEICAHNMDVIVKQIIHTDHEEKAIIILQCTKCGAIDKTYAVTSPPPKLVAPKSECRHRWVKEKTINLNSAFEQMEELLLKNNKVSYFAPNGKKQPIPKEKEEIFDPSNAPSWMFRKTSIRERICELCGTIDRVVSSNFDLKEDEEYQSEEERMGDD
jgi:hypothetical protein